MDEMIKEENSSVFVRFHQRFTSWSPMKRVSFVLLFYFLIACIPMLFAWVFPPPIIITSYGVTPPILALGSNWSYVISIPIALVVLGVFATNIVFRSSEDPRYYLRAFTLVVCIEVAIFAATVAMAAHAYWFGVFAPILGNPIPVEPFPGFWLLSSVSFFFTAHALFSTLLIVGGAVMLFVFICESVI